MTTKRTRNNNGTKRQYYSTTTCNTANIIDTTCMESSILNERMNPGDPFRTKRRYNSKTGEVFGRGSQEEMCIAFFGLYPRKVSPSNFGDFPVACGPKVFGDMIPACDAMWARADVLDTSQLGRTFGVAATSCPKPTPANFPSLSPNAAPSTTSAPTSTAGGHVG
jgi:hypothetical protein